MKMQGTWSEGSGGRGWSSVGVFAEGRPERVKSMKVEGEREGRSQGATGSEEMGQVRWISDLEECSRNGLKGDSIFFRGQTYSKNRI
jgi:hypothetical protein